VGRRLGSCLDEHLTNGAYVVVQGSLASEDGGRSVGRRSAPHFSYGYAGRCAEEISCVSDRSLRLELEWLATGVTQLQRSTRAEVIAHPRCVLQA
jgi:hypothetical protein